MLDSTIPGRRVSLVPLDPARHEEALYEALHGGDRDPRLWDHLPYGPFSREEWAAWIRGSAASEDPRFFAVEGADGVPLGFLSFLRIEPGHRVIEVGHIAFGAALQRTPAATEAIYLVAREAFDALGYRRLEWKCDARNARSRAAAGRFGFTYEGTFRQHMIVKGRNRDTAWFAMLDGEGRQRARLADLREAR